MQDNLATSITYPNSLKDYTQVSCFEYVKFLFASTSLPQDYLFIGSAGYLKRRYRYGPYISANRLPELDKSNTLTKGQRASQTLEIISNMNLAPSLELEPYHSFYDIKNAMEEMRFCYLLKIASEQDKENRFQKRASEKFEKFLKSLTSDSLKPEEFWVTRKERPKDVFRIPSE